MILLILPILSLIIYNFFRNYNTNILVSFLITSSLLSYFFTLYFSWQDDNYLFILWVMCLVLSISDYYYYLVEPNILYSFTLFSFYLFSQNHSFTWLTFILPFTLLLFFSCLDMLLPNSFGGGDVKLLMILAFFLSSQEILLLILVASFIGIVFILINNKLKQHHLTKLPFVPFITIALIFITTYYH